MVAVNILYQFSGEYAPYAGISIESVLRNAVHPQDVHFYLVTVGEMGEDLERIKNTIERCNSTYKIIEGSKVEQKLFDLKVPTYRGSQATNLKLFIKELILDDIDRILYLDCDTIICSDLTNLFEMRLETPLAMCYDSVCHNVKVITGYKASDPIYNGGVILFNLLLWEDRSCQERILSFMNGEHAILLSPDQDVINNVFKGEVTVLPPKYNLQPLHYSYSNKIYFNHYKPVVYYSENEIEEAIRTPIIMHTFRFIGTFPWHSDNVHPQTCYFDKYLSTSLWKDYEKRPSNASGMFKIEKLLFKILPRRLFLLIFDMMTCKVAKKRIKATSK